MVVMAPPARSQYRPPSKPQVIGLRFGDFQDHVSHTRRLVRPSSSCLTGRSASQTTQGSKCSRSSRAATLDRWSVDGSHGWAYPVRRPKVPRVTAARRGFGNPPLAPDAAPAPSRRAARADAGIAERAPSHCKGPVCIPDGHRDPIRQEPDGLACCQGWPQQRGHTRRREPEPVTTRWNATGRAPGPWGRVRRRRRRQHLAELTASLCRRFDHRGRRVIVTQLTSCAYLVLSSPCALWRASCGIAIVC